LDDVDLRTGVVEKDTALVPDDVACARGRAADVVAARFAVNYNPNVVLQAGGVPQDGCPGDVDAQVVPFHRVVDRCEVSDPHFSEPVAASGDHVACLGCRAANDVLLRGLVDENAVRGDVQGDPARVVRAEKVAGDRAEKAALDVQLTPAKAVDHQAPNDARIRGENQP